MPDDDDGEIFQTLLKGGGVIFAGQIINLFLSFLTKIFIARGLGKADYGAISVGITLVGTISGFVLLGLKGGLGRYLPRYDDKGIRRGILLSAFQISVPLGLVTSFVLVIFSDFVSIRIFREPELNSVLWIFALSIPFVSILGLSVGGMRGLKRSLPKAYIRDILLPFSQFLLVSGVFYFGFGTESVAWSYTIAWVLTSVIGFGYILRKSPVLSPIKPIYKRKELLRFSLPLLVTTSMAMIFNHLDTFLLARIATVSDVGTYKAAYPIAFGLMAIPTSFSFLFLPVISELHADNRIEQMENMFRIITRWMAVIVLPLFSILVLFPKVVINGTFGPEYTAGSFVLVILSAGFLTRSILGLNQSLLISIGESKLVMYGSAFAAVVNLVLNLILIPEYLYLGAGIATAIAYGLRNGFYSFLVYQKTGIHPFSRRFFYSLLIGIVIILTVYVSILALFNISLSLLFVVSLVTFPLYIILVFWISGFNDTEKILFEKISNKIRNTMG